MKRKIEKEKENENKKEEKNFLALIIYAEIRRAGTDPGQYIKLF